MAGRMTGWVAYLLLLAPVLGVAQSGLQLVADRYSYLSCMVWAILLATVLSRLWRPESGRGRSTGRRRSFHSDSFVRAFRLREFDLETDWDLARFGNTLESRACRRVLPSMANFHVGRFMAQRGDLAEAEKHLRRAVEINPKNDVIQSNLALVLARQGNLPEATAHFCRALEINPAIQPH